MRAVAVTSVICTRNNPVPSQGAQIARSSLRRHYRRCASSGAIDKRPVAGVRSRAGETSHDRHSGIEAALQRPAASRADGSAAPIGGRGVSQRDLAMIWQRNWILHVCRASEARRAAVVQDISPRQPGRRRSCATTPARSTPSTTPAGIAARSFCSQKQGRLKALITCPYHSWSYSLRGELVRVPSKVLPDGFDKKDYPLYRVALAEWRGFVFVNLEELLPARRPPRPSIRPPATCRTGRSRDWFQVTASAS